MRFVFSWILLVALIVLVVLIILDISMIVSLLRTGVGVAANSKCH